MILRFETLSANNFRNFTNPALKAEWGPGINLILGPNGSGKTNLLEALSILSGWGAFSRTQNVISWPAIEAHEEVRGAGLPFSAVQVSGLNAAACGEWQGSRLHSSGVQSSGLNASTHHEGRGAGFAATAGLSHATLSASLSGEQVFRLEAKISSRISLRLNGKSSSSTDIRLSVPSIIFLTGGSSLIDGSPSVRRLFIDRLCSLYFPPYAKLLAEFRYILRSRAALLRQGKSPDRTHIPYCRLGGWIMDKRREVVSQLMGLTDGGFMLEVRPVVSGGCEGYLDVALKEHKHIELRTLRPCDGPGYDDVAILMPSGRTASESLSRGQKRRLILKIIITAGRLTAMKVKREPVLFFDDLTAELDSEGREWTYHELSKTGWQVFVTSPENPFSGHEAEIITLS